MHIYIYGGGWKTRPTSVTVPCSSKNTPFISYSIAVKKIPSDYLHETITFFGIPFGRQNDTTWRSRTGYHAQGITHASRIQPLRDVNFISAQLVAGGAHLWHAYVIPIQSQFLQYSFHACPIYNI